MHIADGASLDILEIGKAIGSVGAPALLGIAVYVLDKRREAERAACEAEKRVIQEAGDRKLQAAQDKLDEFQNTRIKEQAALIAALSGGAK